MHQLLFCWINYTPSLLMDNMIHFGIHEASRFFFQSHDHPKLPNNDMVCAFCDQIYKAGCSGNNFSSSLVLGHVLLPVRFLPRRSFLLIANYTSELVCWLRLSAIFGKSRQNNAFVYFLYEEFFLAL